MCWDRKTMFHSGDIGSKKNWERNELEMSGEPKGSIAGCSKTGGELIWGEFGQIDKV